MEINLLELWSKMGAPVRGVVILLTIQAIACLTVFVDRVIFMWRNKSRSREFMRNAAPLLEKNDLQGTLEVAAKSEGSLLAELTRTGLKTYLDRRSIGDVRNAAPAARRAMERKLESLNQQLNRGLNILASTGSTAPFVGLLGTVLGIINAFRMIAKSGGAGGIGTIGAAIGEALVVTGYGLLVAIPTVLLFNWLSSRIADQEGALTNASGEMSDRLEFLPGGGNVSAGADSPRSGESSRGPGADLRSGEHHAN